MKPGPELKDRKTKTMKYNDQALASNCIPKPCLGRKDFLSTLFSALDCNQVRYCVLHSWGELPERLSSDLDIAVHPEDSCRLRSAFQLLREKGYTPVQVFNYYVGAYYFVFCWLEELVMNFTAVDVIFEHRRGGLIMASGETLVSGRQRQNIFWVPDPGMEFAYLLAKKTCKGIASPSQADRLKFLVKHLGRPTAERLAGELFLGTLRERVVDACASGRVDPLLARIRRQTWKTGLLRNPLRLTSYLLSDGVRRVRRWLRPTGLFVVILGPDGVGKSTLIEHLVQTVGPAFRRHKIFHWRPMLLWRRKASDPTKPHSRPPHASWLSVATLFAHLLDFWLGYFLVIRPLLARSGLVIFDRYFHDLLADPKRYRFGGPLWLVRFLSWLVPKPDLLLILDATMQVVLSRKQEVAPKEVLSQRRMYLQLARFPHCRVIDGTAPLARVVADSTATVATYLENRFRQQHPCWTDLG
jgi:thymidylate kinase